MTATAARLTAAVAAVIAIAGCSIPPRAERPLLRDEAPLAGIAAAQGGAWPDAQWWHRYQDAQLDGLEERGLAAAPSLATAHTRFDTALRSIEVARAEAGASVQANAQVQRQRLSEHGLIPSQFLGFTWYNQGDLSLQLQYDFDLWGKTRAAVAAAVDEAQAAEAERAAAALMLTAAIADTYFGWQADQARLALANATVAALARHRALAARRVAHGIDSPDMLPRADSGIAAARELEAGYTGSAQIRLAALAALLGIAPAELPHLDAKPLPLVNATLPDELGLDLLARRPDIAANRWRVEAAVRRVDAARAQFYPDISLGALAGLSSIDLGKLFTAGSRTAAFGPALHLPLFGLDHLRAAYGVTQAQLETAAAQYDAAVVDAARDVATEALTLQQIDARRRQRAAQVDAAAALERTAAARARSGVDDNRSLLAAQAQLLQQRDALASLDAQAIAAEIALTKALGGGYRMQAIGAAPTPGAQETRPPVRQQTPPSTR